MKKIFTLVFSSIFSISLFAYDGSRLSISAPGTSTELKIEIDGRKFSLKNNTVELSYLNEGFHQVKIYREKKKINVQDRFGDKRQDVLYNSSVMLKRGIHLDIMVNRFGKVMVDEQRIDRNDEFYNDEDDYYDSDNGGYSNGNSNVMKGREFDALKESLRKEWFENNRLISVKTVLGKSNFTTSQVKELMLLFTFEDNRLEVAKAAYCNTVDKQNYLQLMDALTFSSSKTELARFIRDAH